jgi:hypothetical protein
MHRKKEVVPLTSSGTSPLERSERSKQSAAESEELKAAVVALTLPPLLTVKRFLFLNRNGSGVNTSLFLSSSPVARQCKTSLFALLLSCSPPVDKSRQYKTSSSPGLSPNKTRQNKIFLSSAKIRPRLKEELIEGVNVAYALESLSFFGQTFI